LREDRTVTGTSSNSRSDLIFDRSGNEDYLLANYILKFNKYESFQK
jgi:hypothetical protein